MAEKLFIYILFEKLKWCYELYITKIIFLDNI